MSSPPVTLHGFAYGEDVDAVARRSLGFRLLLPQVPQPWTAEVEALARRLQAAPYPDHWQPTDLFCSVLLSDGQRVIALARYGLTDHTPSQRRGGVELVGFVGPAHLDPETILAVYHGLRHRRAETTELRAWTEKCELADVLAASPSAIPPNEPIPALPVRLGKEGVLLFAATAPSDPDHHLGLLVRNAAPGWQWLPLVGADFPLQTYAQRGPLIAWTPQLAGVALRLDGQAAGPAPVSAGRPPTWRSLVTPVLLLLVLSLLAINLGVTLTVLRRQRPNDAGASPPASQAQSPPARPGTSPNSSAAEQFVAALHELLQTHSGAQEWAPLQGHLLALYEKLSRENPRLRVEADNTRGKLVVAMVHVLSQRNAGRVQEVVKKALSNKGYDPRLIQAACEAIQRQLAAEVKGGP